MKLLMSFILVLISYSTVCVAEDIKTIERVKEVRDISLGMHVSELPAGRYKEYTCEDPLKMLESLNDFEDCTIDDLNLYQVKLKYDHSDNEWAEVGERFKGTRISGHPVVLSILINKDGVIQGLRAFTDPNASPFTKRQAYLLSGNIKSHYGNDGWKCIEKQPGGEEGNTPIGPVFIDNICIKVVNDKRIRIESKFYRAPNQTGKEYTNSAAFEILRLVVVPFALYDPYDKLKMFSVIFVSDPISHDLY